MNLCIIASGDYFSSYGGGQIYVKNLVHSLKERGHVITVISISMEVIEEPTTKTQEIDGVTVMQLRLPERLVSVDQPIELQSFFIETLKNVLASLHVDIVHAHGWKYAALQVCEILSIPCVITTHHGGIVCPNGMLLNNHDAICSVDVSMKNCLTCALHFVPAGDLFAPIISSISKESALKIATFLKSKRNIPYISPAFQTPLGISHKQRQIEALKNSSVHVIAPSHAIADALKRNGILKNKINVIPHGITPLKKEPLSADLTKRVIRFGYIGRITYAKGLHVMIDALKLLQTHDNYELHIYGEGATKSEKHYAINLKKNSETLPIIWHGKVDNTQIQEAYYSFDIMVHPAIYLEVFGLTLLESLSSGRPVIATRCGGPEDFIIDGVNGILAEVNDPKALADAMQRCIEEPEYVQTLAASIRKINTLSTHTSDIEKLYLEMLQ